MKRVMLLAMTCAAMLVAAPDRLPATMIVGTGNGGAITELYEVDETTGATIGFIGSVGFALNDLAWDPTTGSLYGSTSFNDPSNYHGLVTIDLSTGLGSNTGFTDGWGFDKSTFGGANYPNVGLTSSLTGQLNGIYETGSDGLSSVNKATGVVTFIGNGDSFSVGGDGIAYNAADALYHIKVSSFWSVDPGTGIHGVQQDYISPFVMVNGEFNPDDGRYYGAERRGNRIGILDISTGSVSSITTSLPDDVHIVVFVDDVSPVPEPSTFVLFGMGACLMGCCAVRRRFRIADRPGV